MKLQGVGEIETDDVPYLDANWHQQLNSKQLEAYIRYLFIYYREGTIDWNSRAHTDCRATWDGGRDKYGAKHKSVWSKVINEHIKPNGVVPGIWVASHFSAALHAVRIATGKKVIHGKPDILHSDISQKVYYDYVKHFDTHLNAQYASAEASVSTRYTITDAFNLPEDDHVFLVLCDTSHVNAPPFLRYAFADELNCQRAMKKFIWPAAVEYETHQTLYDKFIEANPSLDWFVSPRLKRFVNQIRAHWRRYA